MKICRLIATGCAVAAFGVTFASSAGAQQPPADPPERLRADSTAVDRVPIFDTPALGHPSASASASQRSAPTAAEIRQARAQFRARQRMARIEARKWHGYEPLRPHWNAVPMMSSRVPDRRVIRVPIYVPVR